MWQIRGDGGAEKRSDGSDSIWLGDPIEMAPQETQKRRRIRNGKQIIVKIGRVMVRSELNPLKGPLVSGLVLTARQVAPAPSFSSEILTPSGGVSCGVSRSIGSIAPIPVNSDRYKVDCRVDVSFGASRCSRSGYPLGKDLGRERKYTIYHFQGWTFEKFRALLAHYKSATLMLLSRLTADGPLPPCK